MDELADVQLNVALVSDDPSTWNVPVRLVQAWDANQSLNAEEAFFSWWEDLHGNDQRIHEEFGTDRRSILKELVQEYDALSADYTDTLDDQREIRKVVVRMVQLDLTTEQVSKILYVPRTKVIRMIAWNRSDDDNTEITARMTAEDMLRNGARYTDTARLVGLPEWVVRRWGTTLNIPAREGGFGMAPRERGLQLHDEGMKVAQIVEALHKEFPDIPVKRVTVYKWINRRKHEREGR